MGMMPLCGLTKNSYASPLSRWERVGSNSWQKDSSAQEQKGQILQQTFPTSSVLKRRKGPPTLIKNVRLQKICNIFKLLNDIHILIITSPNSYGLRGLDCFHNSFFLLRLSPPPYTQKLNLNLHTPCTW